MFLERWNGKTLCGRFFSLQCSCSAASARIIWSDSVYGPWYTRGNVITKESAYNRQLAGARARGWEKKTAASPASGFCCVSKSLSAACGRTRREQALRGVLCESVCMPSGRHETCSLYNSKKKVILDWEMQQDDRILAPLLSVSFMLLCREDFCWHVREAVVILLCVCGAVHVKSLGHRISMHLRWFQRREFVRICKFKYKWINNWFNLLKLPTGHVMDIIYLK